MYISVFHSKSSTGYRICSTSQSGMGSNFSWYCDTNISVKKSSPVLSSVMSPLYVSIRAYPTSLRYGWPWDQGTSRVSNPMIRGTIQ